MRWREWKNIRGTQLVAAALIASSLTVVPTPAGAQSDPLPRQWGAVEWTRLSTDTGDLEQPFGPGSEPTDAQIFDVDGDGVNDFVVTNRASVPSGVWYRRHDTGWDRHVFEPDVLFLEAGGTHHDVDGDGDLDIVVGEDSRGNNIYWWENPSPNHDPDTRWARHVIKDDAHNQHHDIIFGDFDGDGADEFIFWNNHSFLRIAEIPADPTAGPWPYTTFFTTDDKSEGMAVADMNLDGVDDLVAAGRIFTHAGGTSFDVEMVDPAMNFTRAGAGQLIPGGRPEVVHVVGDIDLPIDGTSYLTMYEWQDGAWVPRQLLPELTQSGHSLTLADFNGDGLLDIFNGEMILAGNDDAKGLVLYGDGTGDFDVQQISDGFDHHQSLAGDLDGDGDIDILGKPFSGPPGLDIWLNTSVDPGVLPLDQWVRHSVDDAQEWLATHAVWGDFDSDGHLDLASGGWWYRNPGGEFDQPWAKSVIGAPLHNVAYAADFDGDGLVDLLGTDAVVAPPTHPGSVTLIWARSNGDGTFDIHENITPGNTVNEADAFIQGITPLAPDGAGNDQIAISWNFGEFGESGIDVLTVPADPVATTWPLVTISPHSEGEEIPAGDIDGDGDLDLFLGESWLRNDGGTWTHFVSTTLIGNDAPYSDPDRVSLADLDGDGDLDAVVGLLFLTVSTPSEVVWLENPDDPTGEWPLRVIGEGLGGGFAMSVDDIDNDGDPDVALGEHVGDTRLLIFENIDDASSWNEVEIDPGGAGIDHHDGALLVDFDSDGDLDIVSLGWHNTKVWLFENTALQPGDLSDIQPPAAPTDLTVSPRSSTSVTLTWGRSIDDRGIAYYRILRDGVEVDTSAALTFVDDGLAPETTYAYEVIGRDFAGNESPPVGPVEITTLSADLSPPSAPEPITAAVQPFIVDLTWGESTDDRGVVEYVIERDGVEIARTSPTNRAIRDRGLDSSTTYEYVVVALDADGNGSDAAAGTLDVTTATAPTSIWAAFGFEGAGAVVTDASGFGNDATLIALGDRTPGHTGQGFEANGSSGHVDLGALDIPGDELTVMAWIKADDFDVGDARIVSKADGTAADDHLWMLSTFNGQGVRFRLRTDASPSTTTLVGGFGTLTPGAWHHVAATYDGATMRLFVDGVVVASTAKTGRPIYDDSVDAWIGANPTGDKRFDGVIDDVKIFVVGLDATDVVDEMNTPVDTDPDTESPTAPGALTATPVAPDRIDVGWTASSDDIAVAGYRVFDDSILVAELPVSATSFAHTGLAPESTHTYTAIAFDAAGNESAVTGPATATTPAPVVDLTPPTTPGSFDAVAAGPNNVALTWTPSTDDIAVAGYRLTDGGSEIALLDPSATSFTHAGLAPSSLHTYAIVAIDTGGNISTAAGPVVVTTPAPPSDLLLAYDFDDAGPTITDRSGNGNDALLGGSATLDDGGHPDAGGEARGLLLDGADGGHANLDGLDLVGDEFTISMWIEANSFATFDGRLISKADGVAADDHLWMLSTFGEDLRVRLRTDDGAGTTTLISSGRPLSAGSWHFVAATYDGATLALHVDGVQVAAIAKTGMIASDPTVATWIGDNPTADKPFDGRIDTLRIHTRALGTTELQALASMPISEPLPDTTAPTSPTGLTATTLGSSSISVSWTASSDDVAVTGYRVFDGGAPIADMTSTETTFLHTGLVAGSTHDYTVLAFDAAANESPPAGPASATTSPEDTEAPTTPGALTATATGATEITLSWSASTDDVGVASYSIYDDGTLVDIVLAPTTSYVHDGLAAESTHTYEVIATDGSGNASPPGGPVSETTPTPPSGLVVAFDFDDLGPTITDRSGNGNAAALVGTATTNAGGHPDGSAETNGLELDGSTNGHADLGGLDLAGDEFTISAWINLDDLDTFDARIVAKADGVAADDHLWMLSTFGDDLRVRLRTDDGGGTTTLISSADALTPGTWHFVAAVYDGTTLSLHLDGVEIAATAKTGVIAADPTIDAWIGNNPTTDKPLDGHIDTFRIHARALTTLELQALAATPIGT
ncbi:MAG: LamG-like jellyroll fold domain-containing protein [Actinomycetota bacterium]